MQDFSCEICTIFKTAYFEEQLPVTAPGSIGRCQNDSIIYWFLYKKNRNVKQRIHNKLQEYTLVI